MSNELRKALKAARKALLKYAGELSDLDAHSSTFSIANDAATYLNRVLQELPTAEKEAKQLIKKYPNRIGKKRF